MIIRKLGNRLGVAHLVESDMRRNSSVSLLDTSIASLNVGDEIINEACRNIVRSLFPQEQIIRVSTHDGTSAVGLNRINQSIFRIVCGSNILNSNILFSQQWNFGLLDFARLRSLVLLGVGWSNYQKSVSILSKSIYRKKLSSEVLHSVRDSYTQSKLKSIGVGNVLNTGCPTMWGLTSSHCSQIPENKSDNVIFTLTDYRPDVENDRALVKLLLEEYSKVYFWIQGGRDLFYLKSIVDDDVLQKVILIPPVLEEYDRVLSLDDVDFVGTRLHAGIRALQHKRRSIIIGVDNRAIEKKKDFNIPVLIRTNGLNGLKEMIAGFGATKILLNDEEINEWKIQFSGVQ